MADVSRNDDGSKDSSGGRTAKESMKAERHWELLDFMQDKEIDCGVEFNIYNILTVATVQPFSSQFYVAAFAQMLDGTIVEITVDEAHEILEVLYWHKSRKHYELSRSFDFQHYYPDPIGPFLIDGYCANLYIFNEKVRNAEAADLRIRYQKRDFLYVFLWSEWRYLFARKDELIPEYLNA